MLDVLNFKVGNNSYVIKFPSVGDYYAIQANKQALSLGFYNSLIESRALSAVNAASMIDIESTLSILCPKVAEDYKSTNFKKLGIKDYLEIKEAYVEQIEPWWREIEALFTPKRDEEKEGE